MRRLGLFALLVFSTVGIVLGSVTETGADALWPLAWLPWAPIGYMILLRRPGNGVGRASLLIGFSWGVSFFGFSILEGSAAAAAGASATAAWADMLLGLSAVLAWLAIV
jgi:hypothetical protein